jgi:hypothetical protein
MAQGGRRGFAKVSHDIFLQNNVALFLHFGLFSKVFKTVIFEKSKCHFNQGGGYGPMSQNGIQWRGGGNHSKSVKYNLNGPHDK